MSQEDAAQAHGLQTARGTVQLLMGRGLFMVSGYLIAVILARGLGPVEYGIYGMVMSLLLWLEVAGDMGIRRAIAGPGCSTRGRTATVDRHSLLDRGRRPGQAASEPRAAAHGTAHHPEQ